MSDININDDDIMKLLSYAVRTENFDLLDAAYKALGFGRRVPIVPLAGEVRMARRRCAVKLSELRSSGTEL